MGIDVSGEMPAAVTTLVQETISNAANIARIEMFRPGGSGHILEAIGDGIYNALCDGDVMDTIFIQILERDPEYVGRCIAQLPTDTAKKIVDAVLGA